MKLRKHEIKLNPELVGNHLTTSQTDTRGQSQYKTVNYSTVSSIIRRISRLKKYDRKIKKEIGKIQDSIRMGQ